MKNAMVLFLCLLPGCAQPIIILSPGQPGRLAEPITAKVYIADAAKNQVLTTTTIPAGALFTVPPTTKP